MEVAMCIRIFAFAVFAGLMFHSHGGRAEFELLASGGAADDACVDGADNDGDGWTDYADRTKKRSSQV
jgi:hypothetical protein